jgi:hypothetical protein
MPRPSVSKDLIGDLEGACVLALVPAALCILLFAAELFAK